MKINILDTYIDLLNRIVDYTNCETKVAHEILKYVLDMDDVTKDELNEIVEGIMADEEDEAYDDIPGVTEKKMKIHQLKY